MKSGITHVQEIMGGPKLIVPDHHDGWVYQNPVITERTCMDMVTRAGEIFVHAPWATLIDRCEKAPPPDWIRELQDELVGIKRQHPDKVVATAAQHIWFATLIDLWWKIGIRRVYASHKRKGMGSLSPGWRGASLCWSDIAARWRGLELRPLPLYPVNILDPARRIGLIEIPFPERRYCLSFVGASKNLDLHPIRRQIIDPAWSEGHDDVCISATDTWHFEKAVYGIGPSEEVLHQQNRRYNEVLSQSRFSLCPVGTGPNTIRLWESLYAGAVPIIISDSFDMGEFLPRGLAPEHVCLQLPYDHPALVNAAALKAYLETADGDRMSAMGSRLSAWFLHHGWFGDIEWT